MSALKQKLARIGATAGVLAASTVAFMALGGAGATIASAACVPAGEGTAIAGAGSSLQGVAQENWTNATHFGAECPETPVTYTANNSEVGLAAFGFLSGSTIEQARRFIGTDDAPSNDQIAHAESQSLTKPLIVPVAETAIAVVINPPVNCTLKTGSTHGITYLQLNQIFGGKEITSWSQLASGGVVEGVGCTGNIKRVVRAEGSGTTYQFKNYLGVLEETQGAAAMPCALPGVSEGSNGEEIGTPTSKAWKNMRRISGKVGAKGAPNTTWPEPSNCEGTTEVVRREGGSALAEYVALNHGTIGYAALPNAKARGAEVAQLQDVTATVRFAGPVKTATTESNCGSRVYNVPTPGRKGESGEAVDWSQVFGASPTVGNNLYPLCALTYDVAWKSYSAAGYGVNSSKIAKTVQSYEQYVVGTKGQNVLSEHYYQGLPTGSVPLNNVLAAAELAISKIGAGTSAACAPAGEGTAIAGMGSSLQGVAQEKWTDASHFGAECPETPVTYTSTSSGEGLAAFGFTSSSIDHTKTFIGSDDPPNEGQIEGAESLAGTKPLVIPVAETAIAVVINPPVNCSLKTGSTHGISYAQLNQIFGGAGITTWNQLAVANVVEGEGCTGSIVRVVRAESSGTTYQFKNYLGVLEETQSAEGMPCALAGFNESGQTPEVTTAWKSMKLIGNRGGPNIVWPEPSNCEGTTEVVRRKGGGAVAEYVAANDGTIGYAALPDAEANGAEVAQLQDVTAAVKYAGPVKASTTESNCGTRVYNVPTPGREGESGEAVNWSQVFGASPTVGNNLYPLCTLTYDVAWRSYSAAGYGANAAKIAATAKSYMRYVLGTKGQNVLIEHFYQKLPSGSPPLNNVLAAAELATSKIG
jgi:ABC-type phosphate transport system substrate-binding protein